MIVLLIAIFYVHHIGADTSPDVMVFSQAKWSPATCAAVARAKVAEIVAHNGVLGATFKCVAFPESSSL
jgi:hypothetical protein